MHRLAYREAHSIGFTTADPPTGFLQKELTQDEVHLYGSARLGLHKPARRMELWKTPDNPDPQCARL